MQCLSSSNMLWIYFHVVYTLTFFMCYAFWLTSCFFVLISSMFKDYLLNIS